MDWETSENLQVAVLKIIGERTLPSKLFDTLKDHEVIKALCNGRVNDCIIEKLAQELLENKLCRNNDQKVSHLVANIKHTMRVAAQIKKSRDDQANREAELRRLQNLHSSLPLKSAAHNTPPRI